MLKLRIFLMAGIVAGTLGARPAHAGNALIGVNSWYTPTNLSQDDIVKQLAENGVKTFRISLLVNSVDFVIKAYQRGAGAVVIVHPHMGSKFRPILDKLEAAGVHLTSIELGNECFTIHTRPFRLSLMQTPFSQSSHTI